jgi:uncharacterized membrane-anchored protein
MNEQKTAKNRRTAYLLILVVLQVLFLGGIATSYYAVGWFGTEIKIKTAPVDPRDFLYGDYVNLSYEISQLKPSLLKENAAQPKSGDRVYVLLKLTASGLYEAEGIYVKKPSVSPGQAVLRGTVGSTWNDTISIQYGLERFYVSQGTGHDLEKKAGNIVAHVKIASWGQARLTELE